MFSLDTLVSSTNKADRHGIAEILLQVILNTITQLPIPTPVRYSNILEYKTSLYGRNSDEHHNITQNTHPTYPTPQLPYTPYLPYAPATLHPTYPTLTIGYK
jgi:hypothetical protein